MTSYPATFHLSSCIKLISLTFRKLSIKIADRLERILTTVYVVQSYWACFGLHPSSCMWKTKDHNVSETGSVSVLRWMGQDKPTQFCGM
jgi:hypothetical protein